MSIAHVAIGANLGDAAATLRATIEALRDLPQSRLTAASSLYRTAPVGLRNQPDFINGVVTLETLLAPLPLLEALFGVEARFGRRRSVRNAPRTLDLDLLLYDDVVSGDPVLTLPHPRMHLRAFVLAPLIEIAPHITIPGHGSAAALLAACSDQKIERLQ